MRILFCIECGKALQKHSHTKYECPNKHTFWNNPKGAVGIIFRRGQNLLFAVRARKPRLGKLDLVGGFVDYNESPLDTSVREIKEETGLEVQRSDLKLIGAFTNVYMPGVSTVAIIYECLAWKGEFSAQDDVIDFLWRPAQLMLSDQFAWQSKDLKDIYHAVRTT